MLTKTDLDQIGKVIDESLDSKLDLKLRPIKKELRYIRKTVDVLVDRTDREETQLNKRVAKIESHLNIPQI